MLKAQDFLPEEYKQNQADSALDTPPASTRPSSFNHDNQSSTNLNSPIRRNKKKSILLVAFLIFMVVGSAASLYLLQQNQDVRQQAYIDEGGPCDNSSTTAAVCRGKTVGANVYSCGWDPGSSGNWPASEGGLKCLRTTGTYCAAVPFHNTACSGVNPPATGSTCLNTGRPFVGQCVLDVCDNGCDANGRCAWPDSTATYTGDCSGLLASCQPGDCCQVDALDDQGNYCIVEGFTEKIMCSIECGSVTPTITKPSITPPTSTPGQPSYTPSPTPTPGPSISPSPTATPTPQQTALICESISLLDSNNTPITGSGDSNLAIGDQVRLLCTSNEADAPSGSSVVYQFRILDGNGNWTYLSADELLEDNVSMLYTIEASGEFVAQSRICIQTATAINCQDWEAVPADFGSQISCNEGHECPTSVCSEGTCTEN